MLDIIVFNEYVIYTLNIVTKANACMELFRKVAGFGASVEDLKNVFFLFVRSLLEQSATVWHSSLTAENSADLERVQKSACRIILKNEFNSYQQALSQLSLDSLDDRREELCLKFALKAQKNEKMKDLFPINKKIHKMKTKYEEKYEVFFANTERLKNSAVIHMQKKLNEHELTKT